MENGLGRRLLSDMDDAFKRDADIDEFGVIPCAAAESNRKPFVLENHKLGIEAWAVPVLYRYAYRTLLGGGEARGPQAQAADADWRPPSRQELSRAVLLVSAECLSAWNCRKALVLSGQLRAEEELRLASLVLSARPKSSETFSHRRWLLTRLLAPHPPPPPPDCSRLLAGELEACEGAALRYPSNYAAWSHRIWALQHLAKNHPQVLRSELQFSREWVERHISDHSGLHYRHYLLQQLLAAPAPSQDQPSSDWLVGEEGAAHQWLLAAQEWHFTSDLILTFPGHEALWYYRRSVFHLLSQLPSLLPASSSSRPSSRLKEKVQEWLDTSASNSHGGNSHSNWQIGWQLPDSMDQLLDNETRFLDYYCSQVERPELPEAHTMPAHKYAKWLKLFTANFQKENTTILKS